MWDKIQNAVFKQVPRLAHVRRLSIHLLSGNGEFDYNDCWGCVLRVVKFQTKCAQRPFVTLTDSKGSYECNSVGKEHVLRGMYGPQLAWWFTLYDPSQFKIVNSNKFFSVTCH